MNVDDCFLLAVTKLVLYIVIFAVFVARGVYQFGHRRCFLACRYIFFNCLLVCCIKRVVLEIQIGSCQTIPAYLFVGGTNMDFLDMYDRI